MTVRNIRAYQARGLLPPPVVDGRVGYYTEAHRERLTMIRRLRAEGFNLVAISALLTGVVPVTTADPPADPPPDGGLSGAGAALLALGVPVDEVLALHRQVAAAGEEVAAAYVRVFDAHVREPWLAAGSPKPRRHRVLDGAAALPAIAVAAVSATVTQSVHRQLQTEPVVGADRQA